MQRVRRVLKNTVRGYITKDVGKRAASLTYYLLFAIFPFLVALISILGLLHLPMISLEGEAAAFLPADVITLLNRTITHMTEASNGAIFTFGVVFALWFPFRAVRNMTEEVSDIYGGEKPTHHTLRVLLLAIFIQFLIPAMLFLMIIGDSVLNYVAQFLPITVEFISFWTKARFLSMGFALILLTSAVYYLSPSQPPKWRYIFPGALLSTSFWMLYSVFFSYYVDHMGNYSVIYGSIGAIIAFLIWLNLSLTALLLGAVFNQVLRETAAYEKLSSEI